MGWRSSAKPEVNLDGELYEQLKPFRLPLIAVVLMLLIGGIGYVLTSDFSLIDGIYQAGMTFTTLGYTEIAPISIAGRFFTISYVLTGFLCFTFCMGLVIEVLKRGKLVGIFKERRMLYQIARLKNHFVICYHNEFCIELSKQFRENHIPFVVVDTQDNLEQIAEEHSYAYFIKCAPHTNLAFLKTHLSSAKGLITLSQNSADNIAIIASARLFEQEIDRKKPFHIIAFASSEDEAQKLKKLGASSTVSAVKLVGERLSALSARPDMENLMEQYLYKSDSALDIEEVIVPAHSWMRFRRISDLGFRANINVSIIGLHEQGRFLPMPRPETLIGTECRLLLIGTAKDIKEAKNIIRSHNAPSFA